MRMNHLLQMGWAIIVAFLFIACSERPNNEVEYFPYQETRDGDWGLVSPSGKVLCKETLQREPTVVRDGRFFMRNQEGKWELYEAAEQPQKVGNKEYKAVTAFCKGHALVVEKDKPVTLINTKGETIKELHQVEGKTVNAVSSMDGFGNAVFETTDTLYGLIDIEGNCTIKPEYLMLTHIGYGYYFGISKKYKDKESGMYTYLTQKGKVLFEISSERYVRIGRVSYNSLFPVAVEINDELAWGLLNEKGEEVVKPTKQLEGIGEVEGNNFTFCNDGKWGLMNMDGETLIFAKYDNLTMLSENELIAQKGTTVKFINAKDEELSKDSYLYAFSFSKFDGKHSIVKPDDHSYVIIDRDYQVVKEQPVIFDFGLSEGDDLLVSDYMDLDKVVNDLQLKPNSIMGLTLQAKPAQAVAKSVACGSAPGNDTNKAGDLYWYDFTDRVNVRTQMGEVPVELLVIYDKLLTRYNRKGGANAYEWTDAKLNSLEYYVETRGKLKDKQEQLYQKIVDRLKKDAKVVKQNKKAILLQAKDGSATVIARLRHMVMVAMFTKSVVDKVKVENIRIEQYDNGDNSNSSDNMYGEEPEV